MNEVKRYKAVINDKPYKPYAYCEESSDGIYVRLEDYTALQEQLTATTNSLTNAQEALKSAGIEADTVQAGVMELVSRMNRLSGDREKFAVQCAAAKIAVQYARAKGFECSLNTPDVDAYLNAVRAEGADLCVKALVTSDDDDFSDAPNICGMVSAQLRAGNAGKDGSHE
ncbi:hypothetical protein [Pantoea dispersa]|uniref:Uncharacterized protein n=1 Tax=Pantoea dispersa TaxID=59814 RepID=A0ABY2ZZT6_9GAMM|nr:hypothetical protein [Pantoea dispersa]TQC75588.1 hypothetical protein FK492_06615 [Pantoea dispersa]